MKTLISIFATTLFLAGCGFNLIKVSNVKDGPVTTDIIALHTGDIGYLPLINISLQDKETYWLLDTGATHNIISDKLSAKLNLTKSKTFTASIAGSKDTVATQGYYLPTLHISDDLTLKNQQAFAINLRNLNKKIEEDKQITGILGMPALRSLRFTIDYPQRKVTFNSPRETDKLTNTIPIKLKNNLPVMRLSVNNQSGDYMIDTGNPGALVIFPSNRPDNFHYLPKISVQEFGGVTETRLAQLQQLTIGEQKFTNIPYVMPELEKHFNLFAGSLGNALFLTKRVTFDFQQRKLYISKKVEQVGNSSIKLPGGFGFILDQNKIAAIVPGSPAEKAGLRQGDIIKRFHGMPVTQNIKPSALWHHIADKDKIKLNILRNQEAHIHKTIMRESFLPFIK